MSPAGRRRMDPGGGIAAVILAAGRSSRMGANKPLLPLGSASVIERVVDSVSRAKVGDIVVVTGHESDRLGLVLGKLPAVRQAHNAGYDSGMFSSVRTGVAALRGDVDAFFVLPADYPLVRAEVLDRLILALRGGGRGILHPCCCGLRGHPPLLSGRYRDALLQADVEEDLRSFLQRHAEDEAEVEVEDLTILMDMDTAEDYRRIGRFAATLDAAGDATGNASAAAHGGAAPDPAARGGPGRKTSTPAGDAAVGETDSAPADSAPEGAAGSASLSSEDALYLLSLLEVPEQVVRHCRTVAAVGEALARALEPRVPDLDVDLVRSAGLLHDMARAGSRHAAVGRGILTNLGLVRLGQVVGAHMVMPPEQLKAPRLTEEQLVYLADKLVIEDGVASLEERMAHTLRGWDDDPALPEATEGLRTRMRAANLIQEKAESILGRPLEEVLPRETPSSI